MIRLGRGFIRWFGGVHIVRRGDPVSIRLMLIAAYLAGTSVGVAAPLPRGTGPEPKPDVGAPVAYRDLMLVIVTKDGAAAVIFDGTNARGDHVDYSFRYESADGKKKLSGTGKLFERRQGPNGDFDPDGLYVVAGPAKIKWSMGGPDRGWIYYAPEVVTVHLAHADNFKGRVHNAGTAFQAKVEELDLRRFMRK
jgi:hypothetical protein